LGATERQAQFPEAHAFLLSQEAKQEVPIISDWTAFEGFTDNYYRLGFRISHEHVFDEQKLRAFLDTLSIERIKGVLKTQNGSISINTTATEKAIELIDEAEVSGLQLIDTQSLDRASIEDALKACLISA
ncbi:MAG: GTP-binding protein, partial [Sedimenticolaceae bacterium]